ncbi:MAG TPA: ABC transporter permease [Candidatus Angelobacter sp.]|nr:ABC transporter permease [Candidatus Angelobacter sp.]
MIVRFNLRQILRALRRSPLFTTIAISCLAIGIGANAAIFTIIEALFLRSLPVHQPSRLVAMARLGLHDRNLEFSYPMYSYIRDNQKVLSGSFAFWDAVFNVQANENSPLRLTDVVAVTEDYYGTLGIRPLAGRFIGPQDANGSSPANVAVISYGYWQQWYGGNREIIGQSLRIEGVPFTIIGVAPKSFLGLRLGIASDVTIPLAGMTLFTGKRDGNAQRLFMNRKAFWLGMMGRLKEGVSLEQARAQIQVLWSSVQANTIPEELEPQQRTTFSSAHIQVTDGRTGFSYLRDEFSRSLFILLGLVAIMLLFTCTTLANLMLARIASRKYEIGMRIALGAQPSSIIFYQLTEGVVISLCGAASGLVLAYWVSPLLGRFVWTGNLPLSLDLVPDLMVFVFTAGISIVTGLAFSIVPAWSIARQRPSEAIRQKHNARLAWTSSLGLGRVLTGMQVCLAVILLAGATLLTRGLMSLSSINPGFSTQRVLINWLTPKPGGYRGLAFASYYRDLLDNVSHIPGVQFASLSNPQPLGYEWRETAAVKEQSSSLSGEVPVDFCMVTPHFFETMEIPLLRGRDFNLHDDDHSPRIAIISQSLADRLFSSADPIGRKIRIGDQPEHQDIEVVAIAGDANLWNVRAKRPATVYVPFFQETQSMGRPVLEVRASGDPRALANDLSKTVQSLGHEYPFRVETINESIQKALVQERMAALLGKFLGILSLTLALLGIYGLFSYTVLLQTRDLGIRIALGASSMSVIRTVMRSMFTILPIAIGIGLAAAALLSRFIKSLLLNLSPFDPLSYALTAIILTGTAILAAYIPARRASKIDPLAALRNE